MPTRHRIAVASVIAIAAAAAAAGHAAATDHASPRTDRTIAVPGTATTVRLFEQDGRPAYAIDLDGRGESAPRATSYTLELVHGAFDPLAGPAPGVRPALAAGDDTRLFIVQFVTQPLEAYRAAVRDLGGDVRFHLPRHAHLVRMDEGVRAAVAALPFVRWIGPYHPAYRLEPFLADRLGIDGALPGALRVNVMLLDEDRAVKRRVADRIRALGGEVHLEHAGKYLLDATMSPDALRAIVRFDEVLHVDRWGPYEIDMNLGRNISGARFLESVEGFSGEGVRGEVIDVGFNLSHDDFQARPLLQHTSVGGDSHGASTTGIIFGDGSANAQGDPDPSGIIPDAQGFVASTSVMTGMARYDHTAELVSDPWNAVFQSASVGSPRTTQYTTISADMDATLFDFDFVICQSQSNSGDQMSRPQAWAKNIISVGGVRHEDTPTKSDDRWSNGASIGPAADGRVKPDLCHFYDDIRTVSYPGDTAYTNGFGGTSGATPIVAGHMGLIFQMWSEGIFGNPADGAATVFDNRCHMTTAKALVINSAAQYDWTLGGPNSDLDRFKQGWGMPNLQLLHAMRNRMLVIDETDVLGNLAATAHAVEVNAGEPALRATLVYADPPGVPGASLHRINDLDLRVTAPSGTVYWGNNGLANGVWSTSGGGPNERDTVENVFVQSPEAGTWTVEVIASAIVQDGHVETGAIDADYALVVTGRSIEPEAIPGDLDGDGDIDFDDLLAMLAAWGDCPDPPADCPEDADGSGAVDFADVLVVLAGWTG